MGKSIILLKIGKVSIRAEVADSLFKRAKGLMFRKSLSSSQGMIFTFPIEDYHTFWMMFTRISLDILWANSYKKIIHIEKNLQPRLISLKTYKPMEKAKYAI